MTRVLPCETGPEKYAGVVQWLHHHMWDRWMCVALWGFAVRAVWDSASVAEADLSIFSIVLNACVLAVKATKSRAIMGSSRRPHGAIALSRPRPRLEQLRQG